MDPYPRSLVKYFGRVGQEDPESIRGHTLESAVQVVKAVAVRIIHADHPQASSASPDLDCFVDQHPHAEFLDFPGHLGLVVIAHDRDNAVARLAPRKNGAQARIDRVTWSHKLEPVVSGHHAQ